MCTEMDYSSPSHTVWWSGLDETLNSVLSDRKELTGKNLEKLKIKKSKILSLKGSIRELNLQMNG